MLSEATNDNNDFNKELNKENILIHSLELVKKRSPNEITSMFPNIHDEDARQYIESIIIESGLFTYRKDRGSYYYLFFLTPSTKIALFNKTPTQLINDLLPNTDYMNLTKQERFVLCFYYPYKDYVEPVIANEKIITETYFSSENKIIDTYNSLNAKKFIEGAMHFKTKILANGILEVETNDNLLKHCILQELNDKSYVEDDKLIKKITIAKNSLGRLLNELKTIEEIEMESWQYGNSNFRLKLLPKGIKAFNSGKYLEDLKADYITPLIHNEYIETKIHNQDSFNENKGIINQDSSFEDNDLNQSVTTTPSIKPNAQTKISWYKTTLFKYILYPVIAGLLVWFIIWVIKFFSTHHIVQN